MKDKFENATFLELKLKACDLSKTVAMEKTETKVLLSTGSLNLSYSPAQQLHRLLLHPKIIQPLT
jgi:hypothetical protein